FNLHTGALAIGEPFDFKLNLKTINKTPQVTATINLQGQITLNPEQQRYQIKDLKLDLEALGDTLPGGKLKAVMKTDVETDLKNQTASIAPLSIEVLSIKLDGEIKATQLLQVAQINGRINSERFSPRELFKALGQQPPTTSDPKVLSRSSLDIVFSANPDQATLSELKLALDDTQITGKAGIKSFQNPHIDFTISVDDIDIDRYLPPQPAKPKQDPADTKPAPQPSTDDPIALPMETLHELDMIGQLRIGKLKVANLRMSKLQATLTAKNGLVELKPVKISLYKGHIESGVKIDARKDTPGFAVSTRLKNVAMGDLMHDLQQDKAYLRGTGNLNLDLNTQGNRISTLKKKLGGTVNLAVTEGALRDRKLAAKLEAVIAFLKGSEPAQAGEEIIFEKLTGSAKINKGVLRNDDLNLITALILAKGQGEVNLGNDTIDYQLSVTLASKDKNKKRFFVPITLKGPFTDLDYGLDLGQAGKQRLKEEIDEKKQETKEKIDRKIKQKQQELEQKLQDKLKGKLKLF
ncbi:MAG: AsmA family protein, partial [Pseudomonadota bacterium]